MIALASALSIVSEPALAGDLPLSEVISAWLDLNHQEFAVLTTALSLLGFTVVAAILLMRTRVKATRTEVGLHLQFGDVGAQADLGAGRLDAGAH